MNTNTPINTGDVDVMDTNTPILTGTLDEMDTKLIHLQEAHGPRVAHLSDIATADMQMLCNIFPILSSQLMKR